MNELALFAGAGGGILGGHLLGWRTRCAVEFDPYARAVLLARQRDGFLPRFPIWDDVRTFEGRPWRGRVNIVTGGFPCQDISAAGKGAGITGARSGLWSHMARIISEVGPEFAWVENSPLLVGRGLAVVLGDLAEMGYDARWGIVGADDAGAPHQRERIWIVAHSKSLREQRIDGDNSKPQREDWDWAHKSDCCREELANPQKLLGDGCSDHPGVSMESGSLPKSGDCCGTGDLADANSLHAQGEQRGVSNSPRRPEQGERPARSRSHGNGWWQSEPDLGRMAHGLAAAMDESGADAVSSVGRVANGVPNKGGRLKAIGNGQVPASLVLAWSILNKP